MLVRESTLRSLDMGNGKAAELAADSVAAPLDFDAVYEAEFDYVYRVVSRLSAGRDVDDLVQEVFFVVHRRLPDFRGDARITTWLFRIAFRVVGAHLRKERVRRRLLHLFGLESAQEPQPFQPSVAEHVDDARLVRAALERLSYEKRSALVLFEVEGWSGDEIAAALGVPPGTVYTRLAHARRELKAACERLARKEAP
jgi:RNA polymerase sigma-70 factor (ECF subfamily)